MSELTQEKLRELLLEAGASEVGFCALPLDAPYPYGISILYKLSDAVLKTITDKPSKVYFQHYRMVNTQLDLLALLAVRELEKAGFNGLPVAASQSVTTYEGYYPHKTVAVLSHLGYIGKNCLLITEKYGSKVRLATVLTDFPLKVDLPKPENKCGECNICVKICPAGAISGKNYCEGMSREEIFDAEKCSAHMKTYHDIGRGAVCGLCIKNCPKNLL
ncbi:MAG: epoxyqueuosine reductase [Clostridia bacterium]|nr:epoxyqueuosine reductase [Clostridia bacterium]